MSLNLSLAKEEYIPGVLTIDPGDYTGWAYWLDNLSPIVGSFHYEHKLKSRIPQIQNLGIQFSALLNSLYLKDYLVEKVIIEEVSIWEKSLTSMASATRGNLFKLSMVVGDYVCRAGQHGVPVKLIKPVDWKGQLTDRAVASRIHLITGNEYHNSHIYSAVGIGLNEIGIFKNMGTKRDGN